MHDEPLQQCQENQKRIEKCLDDHCAESKAYRSKIDVMGSQLLTAEKALDSTMSDIKEIKTAIAGINTGMQNMNASVKIWVLGGVISTIVVFAIPVGSIVYFTGIRDNKMDDTISRVDRIESVIRPVKYIQSTVLGD